MEKIFEYVLHIKFFECQSHLCKYLIKIRPKNKNCEYLNKLRTSYHDFLGYRLYFDKLRLLK